MFQRLYPVLVCIVLLLLHSVPSYGSGIWINCGGSAVATWTADEYYTTQPGNIGLAASEANSIFTTQGTNGVTNIDTSGVTNPAPMSVYQTNRQAYAYLPPGYPPVKPSPCSLIYTIPNLQANSTYTVRLHFATWNTPPPGPNSNTMNININGIRVLTNFDVVATAGAAFKAIAEEFHTRRLELRSPKRMKIG